MIPRACVLTIAGSDSGGGAGVQADLKTFMAHGCYGASVITALTAQNTRGVTGIHAPDPEFVALQLRTVLEDIPVRAAKTGMLFSSAIIAAVAGVLSGTDFPLVVDPVCVAQSGHPLLREDAVEALRQHMLPLARLLTPNRPEAELLAGMPITDRESLFAAMERLLAMGPRAVLLKGGHMEQQGGRLTDWLGLPVANLRLREQLQDLTYRDPLTGLHNRRYLDDVLTRELAGARRRGTPLGVAVVDLDHFKTLNDTFGHGAGDDVLRAFAGVLGRRFRASDAVCRYGGEEFVVVCSGCAGADLARALDAVREQWAALPLASGPGSTLSSTFSAGVAEFPGDGLDGVQLLRAADAALYAAKGAGRNRVVLGPGSHTAPPARGSDPESGHGPDPPRSGASRM